MIALSNPRFPEENTPLFRSQDIEQSIADRFEQQVRNSPTAIAIQTPTQPITYEQLNQRANQIARAILQERGPEPEPVALLFEQGAACIASILGVLKAGKIYVPLDATFPEVRNQYILENADARLILTNSEHFGLAATLCQSQRQILSIDAVAPQTDDRNLDLAIAPDAPASIIYTSGSTGIPKGALQNQRNVLHNSIRQTSVFRFGVGDRMILLPSASVMASARCLFNALLNGVTLYPFSLKTRGLVALSQLLETERITIFYSVPSLFRNLASHFETVDLSSVRLVILAGDAITQQDVVLFQQHFSESCLLDTGVGSTEAGTITYLLHDKTSRLTTSLAPVGYLMEGIELRLLDEAGQAVPPGEIGEIVIQSEFIALEYYNRPELTQAAFTPDPANPDARTFRTGDLGRWLPDGLLLLVGRKDFQVKIRGNRVETSEIELILQTAPGIQEAIVVGRDLTPGETTLIAYLVATEAPTVSDLRALIAKTLPDYMMPSVFLFLEAFPRTPSGKISRTALPDPPRDRATLHYVAPQTPLEHRLAKIWADVLHVSVVGIDDPFDELGGHSLTMAQVIAKIEQELDIALEVNSLFKAPTIRQLAENLSTYKRPQNDAVIEFRTGKKTHAPLFCFPGATGHFTAAQGLALHLDSEHPIYGIQERQRDPDTRLEDMATHSVQVLQSIQPQGPYLLSGYSFGGLVALEAAQQLIAQGQEVALLILLDPARPVGFPLLRRALQGLPKRWQNQIFWATDRLDAHLIRLSHLKLSQHTQYLLDKLKLVYRLGTKRFKVQAVASVQPTEAEQRVARMWKILKEYSNLSSAYVPQPTPAAIHLFLSDVKHQDVAEWANWHHLAQGGLKIHRLPGNHQTVTEEPTVGLFAQHLQPLFAQSFKEPIR